MIRIFGVRCIWGLSEDFDDSHKENSVQIFLQWDILFNPELGIFLSVGVPMPTFVFQGLQE